MQKIQWKYSNDQHHRFYKGTLMTFWSSLLKTMKTRQTKTYITQNFELVWPIQGRTMWKLTSWGFQKCGTFRVLKVLNQSYWLSKSGEISKKKSASQKKDTRPILRIEARNEHQQLPIGLSWVDVRFGTQFSLLWPCLFFVTPLIFGDESKIADSVDFEQQ